MITDETHYVAFASAYVRGALREVALDDGAALARGVAASLKLHRFKRTSQLPRVRAVIGALRGFGVSGPGKAGSCEHLVDLGSGRGAFVWPLLDALPTTAVTAVDILPHRAQLFADVARGGIDRLSWVRADLCALPFADASARCVTVLEVLEHLPGDAPARAVREAMRVAAVAVIASVPSKPDNNPEHVQLFDGRRLEALFRGAGARKVTIDGVLDHFVVVARR